MERSFFYIAFHAKLQATKSLPSTGEERYPRTAKNSQAASNGGRFILKRVSVQSPVRNSKSCAVEQARLTTDYDYLVGWFKL